MTETQSNVSYSPSSSSPVNRGVCRACLNQYPTMKHIFSTQMENLPVAKVLTFVAPVDVNSKDGLPEFLCAVCYQKLMQAYKFQQLCVKTDRELRGKCKAMDVQVKTEPKTPPLQKSGANFVNYTSPEENAPGSSALKILSATSLAKKPEEFTVKAELDNFLDKSKGYVPTSPSSRPLFNPNGPNSSTPRIGGKNIIIIKRPPSNSSTTSTPPQTLSPCSTNTDASFSSAAPSKPTITVNTPQAINASLAASANAAKNAANRLPQGLTVKAVSAPAKSALPTVSITPTSSTTDNKTKPKQTNFICQFCKNTYPTWEELSSHIGEHKIKSIYGPDGGEPVPKTNICTFCSKAFSAREELLKHMSSHIAETQIKIDNIRQTIRSPPNPEPNAKRLKGAGSQDAEGVESVDKDPLDLESTSVLAKDVDDDSLVALYSIRHIENCDMEDDEEQMSHFLNESADPTEEDMSNVVIFKKQPVYAYHQCPFCSATAATFARITYHVTKTHMEMYDEFIQRLEADGVHGVKCEHCFRYLFTPLALKSHYARHHPKAKRPKVMLEGGAIEEPAKVVKTKPTDDPNACQICNKVFSCWTSLQKHQSLLHKRRERKPVTPFQPKVDPRRDYACDMCDKKFYREHLLKTHKVTHEVEEKKEPEPEIMCLDCRNKYPGKEKFIEHFTNRHVGLTTRRKAELATMPEGCKTCELCLMYFIRPGKYHIHMAVHMGKKWDRGEKNDEAENSQEEADEEEEAAEANEDNKEESSEPETEVVAPRATAKIVCKRCKRRFYNMSGLGSHLRACKGLGLGRGHHGPQCKVCKKRCPNNKNLKAHMIAKHPRVMIKSEHKAESTSKSKPPTTLKSPTSLKSPNSIKTEKNSTPSGSSTAANLLSGTVMHPCKLCSGLFGEASDLKKHYVQSHDFDASLFG